MIWTKDEERTYCMLKYQSAQEAPLYPPQTSPEPEFRIYQYRQPPKIVKIRCKKERARGQSNPIHHWEHQNQQQKKQTWWQALSCQTYQLYRPVHILMRKESEISNKITCQFFNIANFYIKHTHIFTIKNLHREFLHFRHTLPSISRHNKI